MFQAVAVIKGLGGKVRILVANPHEDEDEEAEATLTIEGQNAHKNLTHNQ